MHRHISMLFMDLLLIAIATACAIVLRDNLEVFPGRLLGLLPYLGLTLAVAAPVLMIHGLNRSIWRLSAMTDYVRVVSAAAIIVLSVVALGFVINRLDEVARSLPILQGILMAVLMISARALITQRHATRTRDGAITQNTRHEERETILVAGLNRISELYLQSIAEFAPDRIRIAGLLGRSERHTGRLVQRQKVLGTPEEARSVLKTLEVHGVFVNRIVITTAFSRLSPEAREAFLDIERTSNVKIDRFAERTCIETAGTEPPASIIARDSPDHDGVAFSFDADDVYAPDRWSYWRIKRTIDVVGASCLILLLSPMALLVAVLAAIDLGRDFSFWQQRPGLGGRPFKLHKFRTMAAAHDCEGHRIPDKKRLSGIGRFLRRTRLDELPQLYNILVGDMSFVGPRPLLPADQPSVESPRLLVRPGLTGWAQVKGGRAISASDKAALDIWYVQNASLILDLIILARTVPMVIFGERVNREAITQAWRELCDAGICSPGDLAGAPSRFAPQGAAPETGQAA